MNLQMGGYFFVFRERERILVVFTEAGVGSGLVWTVAVKMDLGFAPTEVSH